jgi:6-pyruvoyl-tetrahydropterin synthase
VEQFVRVRNEFDAHHQVAGTNLDRPRCSRSHGHHWIVEVEKLGRENGLEDDVASALNEVADRSLNEMFPKLDPTPEQLSVLFMEQLLLRHPSIVMVSVSDGRLTGIARNTPR